MTQLVEIPVTSPEKSPEDETPHARRRERLSLDFEAQGVTVESVNQLLDKMRRLATDPQGLAEEYFEAANAYGAAVREAEAEYYALYRELSQYEIQLEDLPGDAADETREKIEQAHDETQTKYYASGAKLHKLERAVKEITDMAEQYEHGAFSHREAFYCVTSDHLPTVRERIDVKDKAVATVASNGDFWEIFAAGGAKSVQVFDISLPALMYSELKLAALENLNLQDYQALLRQPYEEKLEGGFFSAEIYERIRDRLTPQAQAYFDGLLRVENAPLMDSKSNTSSSFIRFRRNPVFVSDIISDETEYRKLQDSVGRVDLRFSLLDINKDQEQIASNEVVYISNINYDLDEALKTASTLAERGSTVIMATAEARITMSKEIRRPGELKSGDTLPNWLGLQIKVLGIDDNRDKAGAVILEVKKTSSTK